MSSTITAIKTNSSTQKDIPPPSTLSSLDQRVATVASSSSSSFSSSSVSSSPTATLSADFGTRAVAQVQENQLPATKVATRYVENCELETGEGTYSGEINEQDQPHGKGILIYSASDSKRRKTYKGDFQNGMFHGNGELTWLDGGSYNGQFVEGRFKGRGRQVYKMQNCITGWGDYEGEFDGGFQGQGYLKVKFSNVRERGFDTLIVVGEFSKRELYNGTKTYYQDGIRYNIEHYKNGEEEYTEGRPACVML